MVSWPQGRRVWATAVILVIAGCAAPSTAPPPAETTALPQAVAIDRSGCATVAVLLLDPAVVRDRPAPPGAVVATLAPGDPIYPCREANGYRAVMFPAPGESADCSTRTADRLCPTGWIDLGVNAQLAG